MEDLPVPSGAPGPGTPRPRTRGARRRPKTPSPLTKGLKRHSELVFPAFSSTQRPSTAFSSTISVTTNEEPSFSSSEDRQVLSQRLHASGLKRSVVQAQLFPDLKSRGCDGLVPRKRQEIDVASSNQTVEESRLRFKPLVSSLNLHPTGNVLIPSRPVAVKNQKRRLLTAREGKERNKVEREPMSARDRYYVTQRASTAPSGRLRRTGGNIEADGGLECVKKVETSEFNAVNVSKTQKYQNESDLPRRGDLVARRNEVKTLTEKLADGLAQRTNEVAASNTDVCGLGTPVSRDSFFYLRRVDSNPYNLEVTSHSDISRNDYYTVSRLGITHFGSDEVEFHPLQTFERENYIYSLLVKLPFFRKYRIWKRFTIWKQAVCARKRMNALVSLNSSLFILLPHLHEALLELRYACLVLQEARLFDFESLGAAQAATWTRDIPSTTQQQKSYTLAEFSLRLKAQKGRVERQVDHFISDAEMTAKTACEKYLYLFLQNTGFNDVKRTEDRKKSCIVGGQRKESTILYDDKNQQKPITYTERATMRTQCRRITKFLRVVEFLITDALLQMAISSTVVLRNVLARYSPDLDEEGGSESEEQCDEVLTKSFQCSITQPLLRVEVVLKSTTSSANHFLTSNKSRARRFSSITTVPPGGSTGNSVAPKPEVSSEFSETMDLLEFIPSTERLRSQLETLVFNGLTAVTNRERLIRNSMFKTYVEASMNDGGQVGDGDEGGEVSSDGMDLDMLIMENTTFVKTLQSLNSIVLDAYEHAEENCTELSLFLGRYQEDAQFCTLISEPSHYLNTDVHDFRGFLDKYMKEAHDVDSVADTASCGLLLLDRVNLNGFLKSSPRKCLDGLYKLIPVIFHQLNESLATEFTVTNDRISRIPTNVDEFSASLAYLRQLQACQDEMEEKYSNIRSLFHLLEEYRVKMTDTDQVNALLLTQKKSQLKASMDLFESSCEQYTAKFGVELEARLPSLVSKLTTISNALSNPFLFDLNSGVNDTIDYLIGVQDDALQLEAAVNQHFEHEKTLGLPMATAFTEMDELKLDLALKLDMWRSFREWNNLVSLWEKQIFPDEIEFTPITEHVERFYSRITKWEQQLAEGMGPLCSHLKSDVEEYRVTMPILTDLRCPSFEERHCLQLRELLDFGVHQIGLYRGSSSSTVTLGELVRMHLSPFGPQINRIATEATQERLLKDTLTKIIAIWDHLEFDIKSYKESRDYYVLSSFENIYTTLEESLVSMTTVLSSKFITPVQDTAVMWHQRLLLFQETFDAWIECQRKWMHLETIFSALDIQKQLPNEGAIFLGINQFWKDLMRKTRDQRGCLKVTGVLLIGASSSSKTYTDSSNTSGSAGQALLDSFTKHNSALEKIEKSLEDYLEKKRRAFPRFYFISNDELLEMLAHAKEPQIVQRHLPKCFDGLVKLDINDDNGGNTSIIHSQDIVAMISPEGERVAFGRVLKARGNLEDWLNVVLSNMKLTLHKHIKTCLSDYQHSSRETWLFRHPAQAVAVVSYIIWAKECDVCFQARSQDPVRELSLWHETICTQLNNLTRLVRTSLTSIQRRVVVSMVTTDVHFRDIVESLVEKKVADKTDFLWQQQLRYQWYADSDECEIHQANCRIKYGYEYMGVCSRLVITPLTDRCWMTITGALELRYGAAPSGPAGTGKTETSKDLAKALGILCIVINCSNQMSYKMMGSILNGVIQAGTWVCLDEFNRIDIEVLSVVGQQMSGLRNARLMNATEVLLDGQCVPLRDHHVIITMNPGYAGRTELPDNLKVSFRPVAMMIPDYALIAEILLFAEGFQLAKPLSRKVTKLYKLCSEQLSPQTHYDFGMRAVRTVLTMAGSLKRIATLSTSSSTPVSTLANESTPGSTSDEDALLIKAMVGANTPKLTDIDNRLFQGIVRDLFPDTLLSLGSVESTALLEGVGVFSTSLTPGITNWMTALEDEINEQLRQEGLQGHRHWKTKLLQLFATLEVRVGVVQTGPTGSGKSTALRVLKAAVTALRDRSSHSDVRFQRVVSYTLNPKSISTVELYGFFHPVTHEWTDGLASKLLRTCIMEKNEEMLAHQYANHSIGISNEPSTWNLPFYWIIFDGPIDAHWIESMNTVLDDNMTLCLANGERIKLLPKIQLIFEVADTNAASPATISRLGVVYYHHNCVNWQAFVETWVNKLVTPVSSTKAANSSVSLSIPALKEAQQPTPLSTKIKAKIMKYFELFVEPGLAFIHSSSSRVPINTSDLAFVATICHIFQALLMHRAPVELFAAPSMANQRNSEELHSTDFSLSLEDQRTRCLDLIFIFSFAWSIGGNLHLDEVKSEFQDFLETLISMNEQHLSPDVMAVDGKIPTPAGLSQATGDVQDFFIDFQYLSFSPWVNSCTEQTPQHPSQILAGRLLVPTLEVLKYRHLVELMTIDSRLPILLTGATGSGKSTIVHKILDTHARIAADIDPFDAEAESPLSVVAHGKILPFVMNLSAQTSSAGAQLSMESKFSKKRRTLLGAPVNKQLVVIFVDDVNMPTNETFGAQPVIELFRQYLEFGGVYDREKFFWKDVNDSVLIAAGGLPGGGRQTLCPRFVRQFAAVFCLPTCNEAAMKAIFNLVLASHIASCGWNSFSKTVRDTLLLTVDATCKLFKAVVNGLLPTPSKCHYTFNLRDVTKLMQGIVLGTRVSRVVQADNNLTASTIVNLWAHEGIRVFRDRLMDPNERLWFSEQLVDVANRVFGLNWSVDIVYSMENTKERYTSGNEDIVSLPKLTHNHLLFSPRCVEKSGEIFINYDQVNDLDSYKIFLNSRIAEYNVSKAANRQRLELVLFEDAMIHTAAIARILIQPRGHALLLGMGGCGKRCLARLASFLTGYYCFEIELAKDYGLVDFREDLKVLMKMAALGENSDNPGKSKSRRTLNTTAQQGRKTGAVPTVFLLNDSQLTSDNFLEDINTILNGGEVPKLFTTEELEIIITNVRTLLERSISDFKSAQKDKNQGGNCAEIQDLTRKDCEDYFYTMVQNSLHFVICMNPHVEVFRARVRQFPALINCTTIDYFDEWPKSALEYVAECYLSQEDYEDQSLKVSDVSIRSSTPDLAVSQVIRSAITTLSAEIHLSVSNLLPVFLAKSRRRVYITSQHYLDLLALFRRIYRERKAQWATKLTRLTAGVIKLEETNALVSTLQDELVALQPVLVSKTKEAEELLRQVAIDQVEAGNVAQRVGSDEALVKKQQQEVAICQADAQRDLNQALPALNAAVAALDALDKKDITEVKGFVKPPQAVQVVMEAVCIMLGEKADWENSKRILSRSTFMLELKEYDKDNIPTNILKKIRKYIENPEFAVEEVKKVSHAAMSLCMWVHAIDTYARIFREVAPKRQRLVEMNAVLKVANIKLEEKQQELAKVVEKVRKLKKKCDITFAEKKRLVDETELTQQRLQNAEKLTEGLSDEKIRWKSGIKCLKQEGNSILGDYFLVAACISYLAPFDGNFRDKLLSQWIEAGNSSIGVSIPFTLATAYGDVQEIREWQLMGLPSDNFSTDNGIFALNSKQRWALMIDPQQQATQWIKRLEASHHLEIIKNEDENLLEVIEDCLSSGNPLLIEDINETLDPLLDPLLGIKPSHRSLESKKTTSKIHVKLQDKVVETDVELFRLYLTTKLVNPQFGSDVYSRVNVINFTVTCDGLEEQLLSDVVQRERMEVEERRHTLLASITRDQKQLQDLEIKILNLLTDAKGNILDDIELIQTLKTSKRTSTVVAQRLAESETTTIEVLEIRNQYQSIARRGAMLFFIISELADIDAMYQFSLEYFNRLFNRSLNEAPAKRDLSERLESLKRHVTLAVYRNICRGLFKAHKQLFALVISLRIMINDDEITQQDIQLLNNATLHTEMPTANTKEDLHSEQSNMTIENVFLGLSKGQPIFTKLIETYYRDLDYWDSWVKSENPYLTKLPGVWDSVVPRFFRLVIVRWLRDDVFTLAVKSFIEQVLGSEFGEDLGSDVVMNDIYNDVDKSTPCLFILSPGADPLSSLERFAREKGVNEERYHVISLGQGQGPIVEAQLEECKTQGFWLVLENVHLAKSWLPRLKTLLVSIKQEARNGATHDDFRLFLASFPVPYIPISVLQNSVKVMTESPTGIKANLQRSMMLMKQINADETTDLVIASNSAMKLRLAFGLSFFHAVVRERSKFGPLGWNLKYEFSDTDFISVVTLHRRLLDAATSSISHDKTEFNDEGVTQCTNQKPLPLHAVPWDALLFLAGEIYYGGRVTDEFDRRCLMAVLRRFYSESCFLPKSRTFPRHNSVLRSLKKAQSSSSLINSVFSSVDDTFFAPEFTTEDEMVRFIDELPDLDGPHVFGMHPNAHISYQRQQTNHFLKLIMQFQPSHITGSDSSAKDSVDSDSIYHGEDILQCIKEMQDKLPTSSVIDTIETSFTELHRVNWHNPLTIVLEQELTACHKLVRYVNASLMEVQNAIQGIAAMSVTIEQTFQSILLHQVPITWINNDAQSKSTTDSLSQWVTNLLYRCNFLHQWVTRGRVLNNVFPLSIFSFPQGLFTAILQCHARKYGVPIHFVDFKFRVLNEAESLIFTSNSKIEEEEGEIGANTYLAGLFLEGAHWNNELNCLCSPQPGIMRQLIPFIQVISHQNVFIPVKEDENHFVTNISTRNMKKNDLQTLEVVTKTLQRGESYERSSLDLELTSETNSYSCPVYRTAMRKGTLSTTGTSTNMVLAMELPCQGDPDYFVLNGTALVLQ